MSPDVIKSFLISLGFTVDDASAKRAEATAARVEKATTAADQRTTSHLSRGAVARANAALKEAGVRNASIEQIIAKAEELQATDKAATSAAVTNAEVRTTLVRKATDGQVRFAASVAQAFTSLARMSGLERVQNRAALSDTLQRSVAEAKTTEARVAQAERLVAVDKRKGAALLKTVLKQGAAEATTSADKAKWLGKLADLDKSETDAAVARQAKRSEATRSYGSVATGVLTGIAAAAIGATKLVESVASGLERTFYSAQRTGASAGGIRSIQYASSQLGSSAEEASASMENLARHMRESPGYESMLNNLGVKTRDATGRALKFEQVWLDLGDTLAKRPQSERLARAQMMGISEDQLRAMTNPAFRRLKAEHNAMMAQAGLDPEAADRGSKAFMDVYRRMMAGIGVIGQRIQGALVGKFGDQLEKLTTYLLANSDSIARTCVSIGDGLLALAKRGVDLVKSFNDLSPSTRDMIVKFGSLAAALVLFSSGPVGALVALAGGIALLADDFRKWKSGDTDTLIDWAKWGPGIEKVMSFIGSDGGLYLAFAGFGLMLTAKVVGPLNDVLRLLKLIGLLQLPRWLLGILGVSGTAVAAGVAVSAATDKYVPNAEKPGVITRSDDENAGAADASGMWGAIKRGGSAIWNGTKRMFGGGSAEAHTGGGEGGGEGIRARARRALIGGAVPDGSVASPDAAGSVVVNGHRYRPSASSSQGKANVASWLDFAQRPAGEGGLGLPADKARAIVAGLQGESSANLDPNSKGDYRNGSPTAFGTAQWRLDRAEGLRRTAASMGVEWNDIRAQQAWMRKEMLEGRYRGVYEAIKNAPNGEAALATYINQYENPAKKQLAYNFRKPYLDNLRRQAGGQPALGQPVASAQIDPKKQKGWIDKDTFSDGLNLFKRDADGNLKRATNVPPVTGAPAAGTPQAPMPAPAPAPSRPEGLQRGLDAMKNFNERFGNAPPGQGTAATPAQPFSTTPLGTSPNVSTKNVTFNIEGDKTTITGVSDPQEAARAHGRLNDRQNADLLRNMQAVFA